MNLTTHRVLPAAAAVSVLLLAGCGEGPVNDNEGNPPGISVDEDVEVEEEPS